MDVVWDGIVRADTLSPDFLVTRQALADAARNYNWVDVLAILRQHKELVNTTRPDGTSLYAPLHQAAHGGAAKEVVQELLGLGAWRTLENSRGERPVDIAEKHGHSNLLGLLTPELNRLCWAAWSRQRSRPIPAPQGAVYDPPVSGVPRDAKCL